MNMFEFGIVYDCKYVSKSTQKLYFWLPNLMRKMFLIMENYCKTISVNLQDAHSNSVNK